MQCLDQPALQPGSRDTNIPGGNSGPSRGYTLRTDHKLPRLELSQAQAIALLHFGSNLQQSHAVLPLADAPSTAHVRLRNEASPPNERIFPRNASMLSPDENRQEVSSMTEPGEFLACLDIWGTYRKSSSSRYRASKHRLTQAAANRNTTQHSSQPMSLNHVKTQ